MFLTLLAIQAATTMQPPRLFGINLNDSYQAANDNLAVNGLTVRALRETERFSSYWIVRGEEIVGNFGICRGRVWSVNAPIGSYDETMLVVRAGIDQFGSPITGWENNSASDNSRMFGSMTLKWLGGRYEVSLPDKAEHNFRGYQAIKASAKCL